MTHREKRSESPNSRRALKEVCELLQSASISDVERKNLVSEGNRINCQTRGTRGMKPKVGDEVIALTSMDKPVIEVKGKITKIQGEYAWINGEPRHVGFLFPARVEAELLEILRKRAELKKAFDNSMSLIFELTNAITRGEK